MTFPITVEEAMGLFDHVCDQLNEGLFGPSVVSDIGRLNSALKMFGPQVEKTYKEQADRMQVRHH